MGSNHFGRRKFVQNYTPVERFEQAKQPVKPKDTVAKRNFAWTSYNFLLVSTVLSFQPQTAAAAVDTVKAFLPM